MLWHDLNCERVLHMCKSHVSDMKESCPTHEGVMSHTWRSHVPQMIWIAICTCARVMSHIRRSHVSHMNESCLTYERVMSHIWRSHVSHVKESCLTHEGGMTHVWRSLVSLIDIGTLWWWSELQLHHALFLQLHLCSQSHHSAFCAIIHHTRTALECCIILQRDGSIRGGDGVATISGPLKMKGLFCKRALKKRPHSAYETYNFKEPTNRRHPILAVATATVAAATASWMHLHSTRLVGCLKW